MTGCPTASSIRFTWCLRPSWRTSSTRPRAEAPGLRRRGRAVVELDPSRSALQRVLAGVALDLGDVRLLDAVARVREPVGERAVVREQERSGRVRVEPPDRDDARLAGHELDDGRSSLRIARGRDDARRLVEQDVAQRLPFHRRPSTST